MRVQVQEAGGHQRAEWLAVLSYCLPVQATSHRVGPGLTLSPFFCLLPILFKIFPSGFLLTWPQRALPLLCLLWTKT